MQPYFSYSIVRKSINAKKETKEDNLTLWLNINVVVLKLRENDFLERVRHHGALESVLSPRRAFVCLAPKRSFKPLQIEIWNAIYQ